MDRHYESEVIVVGAGLAGIVTALELLDAGKRVLLLDRDTSDNIGGLATWAFGGMFFVNTNLQRRAGIRDSAELALHDWQSFAEFEPGEVWGPRWAEQFVHLTTPRVYDWLRQRGIRFFPVVHWVERGLYQPGNSVPRFHMVWGTGFELARVLSGQLLHHRNRHLLQVHHQHRVLEFTTQNFVISGVRGEVEPDGTPFEAKAEAVVVATGGINGSLEKLRANWYRPWGPPPQVILNGSHPFMNGDLHDATARLHGQVTHLDRQWNYAAGVHHPQPRFAGHGISLVPCKSALWVNSRGERFGPQPLVTAFDTRYLVERICQEDEKYSWQILNLKIARTELAVSGSEHNLAFRDKRLVAFLKTLLLGNRQLVDELIAGCEDFVTANSLPELVEKMNALAGNTQVGPATLRHSVESYDANIGRGAKFHNDDQLRRIAHVRQYRGDRMRTCRFQKILDPGAMPLIAIREFILSRKTLGGIQTDLACRVLSQPVGGVQDPIPGLFAVGEAAGFGGGGMHGFRSLEGTFLAACVLNGRIAAGTITGKSLTN
jgi:hypothetical protein